LLPKPGISPPKTLGDEVVKNSYIRLRGGQLILKSFKMYLPSTINGTKENKSQASLDAQSEEWPPLLNLAGTQGRKATLAPEPRPPIQNPNFQTQDLGSGGILLVNGKSKVWFGPSKGLNVLFSWVASKPCGLKSVRKEPQNPNLTTNPPLSQQRRTYAKTLTMEGAGSGKGVSGGRRNDDDRT
jgi:hypothetical protein